MRTSAATPIIVMVVGSIACIAAILLIFFLLIQPTQTKIAAADARYNAAYDDSTPDKQKQAADLLAANQATATSIADQWHVKEQNLMPPFDLSNRGTAWKQLAYELSEHLGPSLERWMSHAGVAPLTSFTIQAPPNSPNLISNAPLVIPVSSGGQVSVGGDFRSILAHVLRWNDFSRLVLIDRLGLHGNSPNMRAAYTAEVIIFPQNPDKLAPGATAPAGGGAGGGMFMSVPGGGKIQGAPGGG